MKKLGLYIHIPFCRSKCSYCDFYSVVSPPGVIRKYLESLIRELKYYSASYKEHYIIDTIYIGGGTPSLLSPGRIGYLMENIKKYFNISVLPEISIEVNPESLTEEHLKIFVSCGINRISMGIQTFNDKILEIIGRRTDKKEITDKISLIKKYKFKNFSFDLIFGLPGQDRKLFEKDLAQAVRSGPVHLSLYSLMLKKNTPLSRLYGEKKNIFMDDGHIVDCYFYADKFLSAHKIRRYEISNFAQKGYECRHNLKYWHMEPVLGLGASAVSFVDGVRWKDHDDVNKYISCIDSGKFDKKESEEIQGIKYYNEKLMLGLRMKHGISRKEFSARERGFLSGKKKEVENFKKLKYIQERKGRLNLTVKGVMVSNRIISELMIDEEFKCEG